MTDDDNEASGTPADGALETRHEQIMGRVGLKHWKQSVISHDGLDERGSVFFAALEMTRMPMILTNPRLSDNPIVFANNAFLDLTGYEAEEIAGRNCRFLQGVDTDQDAIAELRSAIAARQAIALEILNYRRDGSAFWNAVFIGPVYGADGELLYFFASQLDVTARREALQQTVQSQKMEAIGQLTAGLAHDFNNILQIIDGSLERIEARRDQPQAQERFIGAARTAASRGAALTKQLLAFARRSRLEPRATDVPDLVNAIAELLDSTIGPGCTLELRLQRRLPSVKVDPILLETALLNLIINARDPALPKHGEGFARPKTNPPSRVAQRLEQQGRGLDQTDPPGGFAGGGANLPCRVGKRTRHGRFSSRMAEQPEGANRSDAQLQFRRGGGPREGLHGAIVARCAERFRQHRLGGGGGLRQREDIQRLRRGRRRRATDRGLIEQGTLHAAGGHVGQHRSKGRCGVHVQQSGKHCYPEVAVA